MRAVQFTLFSIVLTSQNAFALPQMNLTEGVTPLSHEIFNLHMMVIWICTAIGLVVFGVIIYSLLYHRHKKGHQAAQFHEHFWLEVSWSIIPLLIITGMAIPGTIVLRHINIPEKPDITIKITGYQWKWKYEYLNEGIQFFSNLSTPFDELNGKTTKGPHYLREVDKPLVLPIHKNIRFLMTANDVIHAWWLPDLGVKKDAVPGFINEAWANIARPGTYRGQCAEFCGLNHARMPIVVNAVPESEYKKWLALQKSAPSSKAFTTVKQEIPHESTVTGPSKGKFEESANFQAANAAANAAEAVAEAALAADPKCPAAKAAKAAAKAARETANALKAANVSSQAIPPTSPTPSTETKIPATPSPLPAVATPTKTLPPQLSKEELMKKGEQIYLTTCAACHQPDGAGMPPIYPAMKGGAVAKGPIAAHIHTVLFGKPGTAMQAFKDQFSDEELAAVVTYERNAFGNNMGDVIKVEQITELKNKGP